MIRQLLIVDFTNMLNYYTALPQYHNRSFTCHHRRSRGGFALWDLLGAVLVVSIVLLMLPPILAQARSDARIPSCLSNLRWIGVSMHRYAEDHADQFPPSTGVTAEGSDNTVEWYDNARVGGYLASEAERDLTSNDPNQTFSDPVLVCPSDLAGAARCYGMNVFASSVHPPMEYSGNLPDPQKIGQFKYFDRTVEESSSVFLATENWSQFKGMLGNQEIQWFSAHTVGGGLIGTDPSRIAATWFGANGGQSRLLPRDRFGISEAPSSIDWSRHGVSAPSAFAGTAGFVFVDGHVQTENARDLVDPASGQTTDRVLWTAAD